MLIATYKVTAPNLIEQFVEDATADNGQTLVKVDKMAICKADIRYFLGLREQNVLDHKYPLAPIHEAVGHVVKDFTGQYKPGDKVILIPNSVDEELCKNCPNTRCELKEFGQNYCPHAIFRSSNKDGFMKPFYVANKDGLVKFDSSIDSNIAVFSELLSVSVAACRRIQLKKKSKVALFGDGIMAYIVYLTLVHHYKCDVTVFGVNEDKLNRFEKAEKTKFASYKGKGFDTLIECVGGVFSADAINQMINIANVGADLLLMGVNEANSPINTRKILEKGLSLKGVTRSSREDFIEVSKMLENKDMQIDLNTMLISVNKINSVNDIYSTFEKEIANKTIIGKNILEW